MTEAEVNDLRARLELLEQGALQGAHGPDAGAGGRGSAPEGAARFGGLPWSAMAPPDETMMRPPEELQRLQHLQSMRMHHQIRRARLRQLMELVPESGKVDSTLSSRIASEVRGSRYV